MTEERLAELEQLKADLDRAVAAEDAFCVRTATSSTWPAQGHPQYEAFQYAQLDFTVCFEAFKNEAIEAVPELIAEVRRLRAELKRVAPLLAMRGAAGYSFGPFKPTEANP